MAQFQKGTISFLEIADLIEGALNHLEVKKADELLVIREADRMARNWVQQRIAQK